MSLVHLTKYTTRKLEWSIAFYTVLLGSWLLRPVVTLKSPTFSGATHIMPEFAWGACYFGVGVFHALALQINGRAWWTPLVRLAALLTNMSVLILMGFSLRETAPNSMSIAHHFLIAAVFCGPAIVAAAHDCGNEIRIWWERKNGRV